jgi:hypothetical protein
MVYVIPITDSSWDNLFCHQLPAQKNSNSHNLNNQFPASKHNSHKQHITYLIIKKKFRLTINTTQCFTKN